VRRHKDLRRTAFKTRPKRKPISHDDGVVWTMDVAVPVVRSRSGQLCERCGGVGEQFHHRAPRGMGGSRSAKINAPSNLLHLCRVCHEWVESNRDAAKRDGLLVRMDEVAEEHAVVLAAGRVWLLNSGAVTRRNPST
jgi:5-methylcytosine-specific restriction protein A